MKLKDNRLIIEVEVNEGQKIANIKQIYPLPSDAIIHKVIPGIGATHGEIIAPRHSLIVLPNVPVIASKVTKHNSENEPNKHILGVYQKTTKEQILSYFEDATIKYKKILVTPESYDGKLKNTLGEAFETIKQTYYLLIDECERAIQDVDFRPKITAPFDDLFEFTTKGLISATTLPFSDPRLEAFTHYVVKPSYDYQQPLSLIITNNLVSVTRGYFDRLQSEKYFIFTSSITLMKALITALDIKQESVIHCAEDKARQLKKLEGYQTQAFFEIDKLKKYNFFTSRFYSAVDINLPYPTDVLMLTEVVFAEHSILDPQTEVIQIPGRFRNGRKSITHITNTNSTIVTKTREQILEYIKGLHDVFMEILALKKRMPDSTHQEALNEILESSSFTRFFYEDGSYNWFMVDNYIQEQRVLGMYKTDETVEEAYKAVDHYYKVSSEKLHFPLSDADRLKRETAETKKELFKVIIEQYNRLFPPPGSPMTFTFTTGNELSDLKAVYPLAVEAMQTIGEQAIIDVGYNERKIAKAVKDFHNQNLYFNPKVCNAVYTKFDITQPHIEMYCLTTLQDIYDRNGINEGAKAHHILRYFGGYRTTIGSGLKTIKAPHGYKLTDRKFEWVKSD